ncbi:MAG TPA: LysM peptidoglycan-binding domain-containing protein [Verrucomicrobiae bacterium]|nr:LysM peptidoglycan-binding domain-containing protein [Verrucomicrobiae bacterium]
MSQEIAISNLFARRVNAGSQLSGIAVAPVKRKKRASRAQKFTTIATYTAVFVLIATFVAQGYRSPVSQQLASQRASSVSIEVNKPSVDQLVATSMAATMAETAELPVATNVANLSISLSAKGELAQTDDDLISKPQIVQPSTNSRNTKKYRAVTGDTVPKLADKFGVSADTIRWANKLTTDALTAGQSLVIPATDGILYTVKRGDTLEALAKKYGTDKERIVLFNDLELTGLTPGKQIMIPSGVLPETERPGYTPPQTTFNAGGGLAYNGFAASASVGNRYDVGYCTWWVYERRAQTGRPIGSFWGNATSWAGFAASAGFKVNNTPAVGSIMQSSGGWGGYGHVAFVERVNPDGSVYVSEMNYQGWSVQSFRTIPAGQAQAYNYIH